MKIVAKTSATRAVKRIFAVAPRFGWSRDGLNTREAWQEARPTILLGKWLKKDGQHLGGVEKWSSGEESDGKIVDVLRITSGPDRRP